jgi:hypothetical protein
MAAFTGVADVATTDELVEALKTAASGVYDTHTTFEAWAARWTRTMHRRLMAQGLNDEDAARLCRMMRTELNAAGRSAVEHAQNLNAVRDALGLIHDEVNRARRSAGQSGVRGVNMSAVG